MSFDLEAYKANRVRGLTGELAREIGKGFAANGNHYGCAVTDQLNYTSAKAVQSSTGGTIGITCKKDGKWQEVQHDWSMLDALAMAAAVHVYDLRHSVKVAINDVYAATDKTGVDAVSWEP